MGYGEIRKAIRELEDQQRADYNQNDGRIRGLAKAGHIEADLRIGGDVMLAAQVDELSNGQVANRDAIADIRFQFNAVKRPLEHRVSLQDQADLLQKSIDELTARLDYLADAQKNHVELQSQVAWLQGQVKKLEKKTEIPGRPILERFRVHGGHLSTHEALIYSLGERIDKLEKESAGHQRHIGDISIQIDEMWDTLMPPGDMADIEAAQAAHDKQELDRLVDYIKSEVPDGAAGMDENVTDTVIRLLKRYRAALREITTELCVPRKDVNYSITNAYRIAWDALDASLEQSDDVV